MLMSVIAAGGIILGIFLVIYGFELVSVPRIREYSEKAYVFSGLVLFSGGLVSGVLALLGRHQK